MTTRLFTEKARNFLKRSLLILLALAVVDTSAPVVNNVYALDEELLDKYAANNIMFYDPEVECDDATKLSGKCGGEVEGDDNTSRTKDAVAKYGEVAINLQIEYGVPWELVFGQFAMESSVGTAGVAVSIWDEMNGYNWLGHHGPDPVGGACPNTAGKHSIDQSWGPNGHNHCFRVYQSIADMIGGHMFDFLRNGLYDEMLQNATASNWNLDAAGLSYVCMYVQGQSTSACDTGSAQTYWNGVKTYMTIADGVASEKGWPTSEEVAKNNNLAAGGKHTTMGNITGDVPNHSMHYDCSEAGGGTATTGSKIMVIGDDIITQTKDKEDGLAAKLSTAEFYTKEYLGLKDGAAADDSVIDKIKDLKNNDSLRDVIVVAAGTDNGTQTYSKDDLTAIVDEVGNDKQVVFVTLYNGNGPEIFDAVNGYMRTIASEKENVKVADWANSATTELVNDDMHTPSDGNGVKKFTDLIVSAVGAEMYNNINSNENCDCDDNGSITGGLTEEQAEKLIEYYKDPSTSSKYTVTLRTDNCVNMSGFFVQLFSKASWASDNGRGVVHELLAANPDLKGGTEVQPFSIFSVVDDSTACDPSTSTCCDGGYCGHTGVVVAVNGTDIMTVEAAWEDPGFTGVKHHTADYFKNTKYPNEVFAYLNPKMDYAALTAVVGGSINTSSSTSTLVNTTWADGWMSSGIEGFQKLSAAEDSRPIGDASTASDFVTNGKDGTVGPNKITMIATDRIDYSSNILDMYDYTGGDIFPPHFTVDMKHKKIYQHLPITKPGAALSGDDNLSGGIQVALIGFSDMYNGSYDESWDLQSGNFGDSEWAYLALLLQAITTETEIPKETSADWSSAYNKLSATDWQNATGFVGAMHAPNGDYTDPGNIWEKINTQLAKMGTSVDCDNGNNGEFVWYNQCDSKWGSLSYGECNDICGSGCGCTSFAMMATQLTGKTYTPDDVCTYAGDKGMHICGVGSSHALPETIADHYGLTVEDLGTGASTDTISDYLKKGYMIWTCGSGAEPYTSGGHCIGIRGITSGGKWLIADSKGNGETTSFEEWDPETIHRSGSPYKALKAK